MAAPPTLVQEQLCGACSHAITAQVWSADGELLAMATAGGELLRIDFRAGCEELLRGEQDSSLDVVGFSADDRFLMATGQDGELLLWDGANRSLPPESQELKGTVLALAWSRDGQRLAAACHGEVLLWSPDDPAQAPQRSATASAGLRLGWSGQGNLLASGQLDGSLMLWPDGGAGRGWQFRGFPGKARALTWCDQPGRLAPLLAVASADIAVLWSQQDRGAKAWKPEPLVLHEGRVHAVAFAPGSSLLATASGDGTVASRASGGSGP